jgi:hypothetical protein
MHPQRQGSLKQEIEMKTVRGYRLAFLSVVLGMAAQTLPLAAHAADLVFGQVASLSNPTSASNAQGLVAGISACFETINAKGGINGHKLKLETRDDGLQAAKMVDLTRELVNDASIIGLMSYLNSGGINALAKDNAFGKAGVALIAPLQGDRHVVDADNVFPLRSGYADEVNALLKEAKNWGKETIAVVNMNAAFGPGLADLVQARAGEGAQSRFAIGAGHPSRQPAGHCRRCCANGFCIAAQGHLPAGGGQAGDGVRQSRAGGPGRHHADLWPVGAAP